MLKAFVIVNRGWKANRHFLQNVLKRSSVVSHAHLSSDTYTACVEWCGIGHQEFTTLLFGAEPLWSWQSRNQWSSVKCCPINGCTRNWLCLKTKTNQTKRRGVSKVMDPFSSKHVQLLCLAWCSLAVISSHKLWNSFVMKIYKFSSIPLFIADSPCRQ